MFIDSAIAYELDAQASGFYVLNRLVAVGKNHSLALRARKKRIEFAKGDSLHQTNDYLKGSSGPN